MALNFKDKKYALNLRYNNYIFACWILGSYSINAKDKNLNLLGYFVLP